MRVVLLKEVKQLGKPKEIVDVADGFARNFLIPKGLAKYASDRVLEELKKEKLQDAQRAEEELKKVQEMASAIDGLDIVLKEKVAEQGDAFFAAITPRQVSEILKTQGYDIRPSQLHFKPIKYAGEYPVTVTFEHGLESQIKIIVEEMFEEHTLL